MYRDHTLSTSPPGDSQTPSSPRLSLHLKSEGWSSPAIEPVLTGTYIPAAAKEYRADVVWRSVPNVIPALPDGALPELYESPPDCVNEAYLRLRADASSQLFMRAVNLVDAGLADAVSTARLADALGLRKASLARLIRENSGKSIASFVRERRVACALQMLRFSADRLGKISIDCGFSSQSYFSQIIRYKTGVSPLEYRRMHLKQLRPAIER